MELSGRIHEIGTKQTITDKLTKQDLIILDESNAQYPEYIKIEALNAKCDLLNNLSPGQRVTVSFNLKGRESKGNYYNSLQLWKIE